MAPLLWWTSWLALAATGVVDLPWVLERARPSVEERAVAAELAEARQLLAETARGFADGPTLATSVGSRRADGRTRPDVEVALELARLPGGDARARALAALNEAERLLPAAARSAARSALAEAYVEAWAAEQRLALRSEEQAAVAQVRARVAQRVEAGADRAFELDLLDLELEEAAAQVALAHAARRASWARLTALAELGPEPLPLAPPRWREPSGQAAERGLQLADRGLLAAAERSRAALAEAFDALARTREQSRWAWSSAFAREGDETALRVGVGYRFARAGEAAASAAAGARRAEVAARRAELAVAQLEARRVAAQETAARLETLPALDLSRASAALELRFVEGKARASEILPLRRSLLTARESRLERAAALALARLELLTLTAEEAP
jgi:outer membrane protein, heavy metal efflux system